MKKVKNLDDVLLLTDPLQSVAAVQSVIEEFGRILFYKVNSLKSQIIGLNVSDDLKKHMSTKTAVLWAPEGIISYLGNSVDNLYISYTRG